MRVNLKRLSIKFGSIKIVKDGKLNQNYDEKIAANYMKGENIDLDVEILTGTKNFTAYTMDLTNKYINIKFNYSNKKIFNLLFI